MIRLLVTNLNILLKLINMTRLLLTNVNILLKLNYFDRTIVDKFKCFTKIIIIMIKVLLKI
jgi:hypothetical protein